MPKLKLPCEEAIWKILPVIRKEIAKILVREYSLSHKKTAKLLGVSEAAISQYLREKRGKCFLVSEEERDKMRKIARTLLRSEDSEKIKLKICVLCNTLMKRVK